MGKYQRPALPIDQRIASARSAFITWLATPTTHRQPELATLEKFSKVFRVEIPELLAMMSEPGFMDAVVEDVTHWKAETKNVIAAIKRNAESADHPQQLTWVTAYLHIVGHPAAEDMDALRKSTAK